MVFPILWYRLSSHRCFFAFVVGTGASSEKETEGLTSEIVNCNSQYEGAYWVKTKSREAFAWQGEHVVSKASSPGVPSLLE